VGFIEIVIVSRTDNHTIFYTIPSQETTTDRDIV